MSKVLQVLKIFEIYIFHIFKFSGIQKWTSLIESNQRVVMVMVTKMNYLLRSLGVFRKCFDKLLVETDIFCHFWGLVFCNAKRLPFHIYIYNKNIG